MDTTTEELIKTLDELSQILESDGALHWSSWMRSAAVRLKNDDSSGADYLLRAYGGMGSLNDLILGQTAHNGTFAWKPGHLELNERFESLRNKAWQLAQHLRHPRRAGA
jgi:hypothetical protein